MLTYVGAGRRNPLYDGLGSTRQLATASGWSITDTYQYEAFGNLMASTGSSPNPYKYVGSLGYYQTGSSLQHLGARYYMPEVGRFVHQDPTRIPPLYVYAANAPTRYGDPSGRWTCTLIFLRHVTNKMVTGRSLKEDWHLESWSVNPFFDLPLWTVHCVFQRVWEVEGIIETYWLKKYLCWCPLGTYSVISGYSNKPFQEDQAEPTSRDTNLLHQPDPSEVGDICRDLVIDRPLPQ